MNTKLKKAGKPLLVLVLVAALILVFQTVLRQSPARVNITENNSASRSLFEGQKGKAYSASIKDEYLPICENSRYRLSWRQDIAAFSVDEKAQADSRWNMAVTQDLYNVEKSTKTWKDYMQSLLAITYANKSDTRGNFLKVYSASIENTHRVMQYQNGLSVQTDFNAIGITITTEIRLDEEGISIRIPAEEIAEKGGYLLLSIEVLPFFGAAASTEEGYLFYPDGSGALTYFSETVNKHLYTTGLNLDVYGPLEHSDMLKNTVEASAMLPVYGIKKGSRAFLAAITEGDTYARVQVNAALNMSPVKLNRANFEFIYRSQYRIYLSNIVIYGRNAATNLYGTKLDRQLLPLDREIKLFFLNGEQADYSGMANVYRSYLKDNGLLIDSPLAGQPGLSLTLFMGAKENSGIFKKMVPTTTMDDAVNILEQYLDSGIESLQVNLRGWSKNGYGEYPESPVPSGALGGTGGLKQLNQWLQNSQSVDAYMEMNFLNAIDGVRGFNVGRDAVLQGNSIPLSNEERSQYLMAPARALKNFEKAITELGRYKQIGLAFQEIGKRIYHDSNSKRPSNRQNTKAIWQDILSRKGSAVAVEGGNLYVLSTAQRLYDIPINSSKSHLADEDIPWYQMVVYGSIPYSAQPGNLSYDLEQLKLKWIEYGCTPHFELTQKSPTLLKNTNYNLLFTSENDKWKDRVIAIYREFAENLKPVRGAAILRHERIKDELVKITYDNQAIIWINYGLEDVQTEGLIIPSKSYLVKEGGR